MWTQIHHVINVKLWSHATVSTKSWSTPVLLMFVLECTQFLDKWV
jgi:hypothetical protein